MTAQPQEQTSFLASGKVAEAWLHYKLLSFFLVYCYFSVAGIKHHGQRQLKEKRIYLASSSRGITMQGKAWLQGRHGNKSRKLRDHTFSHKHESDTGSRVGL